MDLDREMACSCCRPLTGSVVENGGEFGWCGRDDGFVVGGGCG